MSLDSMSSISGITMFPSTGMNDLIRFSYVPFIFKSAMVLLIDSSNSVLPFFTAIAYDSLIKSSFTITRSGLRFTISFAGNSSRTIASIAPFFKSREASIPVLKDFIFASFTLSWI